METGTTPSRVAFTRTPNRRALNRMLTAPQSSTAHAQPERRRRCVPHTTWLSVLAAMFVGQIELLTLTVFSHGVL